MKEEFTRDNDAGTPTNGGGETGITYQTHHLFRGLEGSKILRDELVVISDKPAACKNGLRQNKNALEYCAYPDRPSPKMPDTTQRANVMILHKSKRLSIMVIAA